MMMRWISFIIATVVGYGCSQPGCLEIQGSIEIMKLPYPADSTNAASKVNQIVGVAGPGKVAYVDKVYTKEYLAYETRTKDGVRGYIVGNGRTIRECEKN